MHQVDYVHTQEKYNKSSDLSPRCISTVYFAITGKYRFRVTHKFRKSVVGLFKYEIPVLVIVFFCITSFDIRLFNLKLHVIKPLHHYKFLPSQVYSCFSKPEHASCSITPSIVFLLFKSRDLLFI